MCWAGWLQRWTPIPGLSGTSRRRARRWRNLVAPLDGRYQAELWQSPRRDRRLVSTSRSRGITRLLRSFETELAAVADRVAEAEREARALTGPLNGREEKYTEHLRAQIHSKLNGLREGALACRVFTVSTDRHREQLTGADLAIAVDFDLDGVVARKGVLIQAKVNKNKLHGVSFDSLARLKMQCRAMRRHTKESFVFAYGEQSTKVLPTLPIIAGAAPSKIDALPISAFFQQMFLCWRGDEDIAARSQSGLRQILDEMEARAGVLIKASASVPRG